MPCEQDSRLMQSGGLHCTDEEGPKCNMYYILTDMVYIEMLIVLVLVGREQFAYQVTDFPSRD